MNVNKARAAIIRRSNVNTSMPKILSLTKHQYEPVDGYFTVPKLPGIGNEIADQTFARSTVVTIA